MKLINTNTPRLARGFTLIELMITAALVAIAASIALPSFQGMIREGRLTAQANELISALNIARSEAIRRGQNVTVTPVGSWSGGWNITTVDPNTAAVIILRSSEALTSNLAFAGSGVTYTFLPTGFRSDFPTGAVQTHTLCDSSAPAGQRGRRIFVSVSGRPRVDTSLPAYTCP